MTGIAELDATGQAELIRSKQCSPAELLEETIAGIERLDPQLNAVVIPLFDEARGQLARGELGTGPFRGVPMLLKDLGATLAGTPQYGGTRVLRDRRWVSPHDSELVARFRRAGFLFVGKANTPELGLSPTTEPETFGPTRNPWDPSRIVGGSSGGSAAAVAARLVALAHAGDGGGSIRNPAGACGIAGLKPSRGRITLGPDKGEAWSGCVTEFVVARSVRDLANVLDCVHGALPGDPHVAPPPARRYAEEPGRSPGRLRIGTFLGNASYPGNPDARAALEGCAKLLATLGHDVHDGYPEELDHDALGHMLAISVAASVAHELATIEALTGSPVPEDGVEPATWAFAERGRALSVTDYLANLDAMHRYAHRLAAWWNTNDLLVTPTMSEPPPAIGTLKGADVERIVRLVPYTSPYNVSGQPGIALPLHWTAEGLPLGVQLVARHGEEDLLLRVGAQLEAAAPWSGRRPRICV
ncbi:MAG: amidase [Myxococcota bacterium]